MKLRFVLGVVALALVPACGGGDDDGGSGGSSGTGAASGGGAGGSGGATGGTSSGGAAGSATGGTTSTGGAAGGGGTSATGGAAGAGGGTGGTSSGGTGGTGSGGTGGTAACNTLVNDGPDVPESAETGTPPTMTGGTIADGTYVLSARKDWQGSCNCNTRQKLSISGTTLQVVTKTDAAPEQRLTTTIATSGNKLSLTVTCPAAQNLSLEYTATATQLQVFDPNDQSLQIFTKK